MIRRGPGGPPPRRTDVLRYGNGRIKYQRSKDEPPVPPSILACIQRVMPVRPILAEEALRAHFLMPRVAPRPPPAKKTKGRNSRRGLANISQDGADPVQQALQAAHDQRLSYPLRL